MSLKLYRRGKTWHYRGTVAGNVLRGSTKTTNKEIAARIVARLEARNWESHISGPKAILTFAEAVVNYIAAGKQARFLPPILAYWKETLVKDMTGGGIRNSAIALYPLAANATRNRQVIIPTQAVINHNAESELCDHIRVKRFKAETKIKQPATLEWIEALMKHCPPHLAGLGLFMFLTGARVGEALALRWSDVDLDSRTALIRQTKVGADRKAHLPQKLIVALANIKREPARPVFRYMDKSAADKSWRAAVARASIEPLSFHSCRHGFATALLRAGVDVITVAKLGGWADASHVFKTYGHAIEDATLTDRIAGARTEWTQEILESARSPMKIMAS